MFLLLAWGDPHYVGLNGLEIYDANNNLVPLFAEMIEAQSQDINMLRQEKTDVRTLDTLYDGVNSTFDDRHLWLSPFTAGQKQSDILEFSGKLRKEKWKKWKFAWDDVLIFSWHVTKSFVF